MILYKIKDKYKLQRWYSEGVFQLIDTNTEKYMPSFGIDCLWFNLETREKINIWDRCMKMLSPEESTAFLRELNLKELGIV
jgi:hypothetical protein